MDLLEYLQTNEVDQPLPRSSFETFDTLEPQDLTEVLSQQRPALRMSSVESLQELIIARYRWIGWRHAVAETNDQRVADGLEALAPSSLGALRADEVYALDHLDRASAGDESLRTNLFALYQRAVTVIGEQANIVVSAAQAGHPRASQFARLLGAAGTTGDLDAEGWFEIIRGVRTNALKIDVGVPWDAVATDVDFEPLAARMADRAAPDYCEAELSDLSPRFMERLTSDYQETLMRRLSLRYHELLSAEPIRAHPLGAIYVGTDRQRVGMTILDKKGAVSTSAPIRPSGDWAKRAVGWMKQNRVRMVAVPNVALAQKWLDEIMHVLTLEKVRTTEVDVAGLLEARSIDDPRLKRVSTEIASAIVLARRAAKPLDEWTRVDPLRLGLSRIQKELDGGQLREIMQIVRERTIATAQPLSTAPVNTSGLRGRASAPLNPEITGIRDLRPGLQLNGIITNVTKFGAFVNIGIKQEGLVHISELSDQFVSDPNEVVQSGQQVSTRVISVDLDRGRIALSMRSENSTLRLPNRDNRPMGGGRPERMGQGPGGNRGGAPATPADRAWALQDLERLFQK